MQDYGIFNLSSYMHNERTVSKNTHVIFDWLVKSYAVVEVDDFKNANHL